jgi:hypothetical protein
MRANLYQTLGIQQSLAVTLDSALLNSNWLKWIRASVYLHFSRYKGNNNLYLEGDERLTGDWPNFAELRMDGPLILMPQKGLFYLDYDVNILVSAQLDQKQLYKADAILGSFLIAFTEYIMVYRYGTGPLDDQTLLGCLKLHFTERSASRGIEVNTFGIIRQDTRITQSTIEGHYRIELTDEGVFPNGSN